MSFYGQMRWGDFQKFFYNFSLTNREFIDVFNAKPNVNGSYETVTDLLYHVQPNEDFATFQINTANHWIKMCPIDSRGDEGTTFTGFSIFHNEAETTNLHYSQIIQIVQPEEITEEIQELGSGTCFKVLTPKYDRAGHQPGNDYLHEEFFKIPIQRLQVNQDFLELNENGYFHFVNEDPWVLLTLNEDSNILTFSHATPEGFSSATISNFNKEPEHTTVSDDCILEPGDKFSSYQIEIDDAGHVTALTQVFFQLPVDKIDEALAALELRVNDLEIKADDFSDRISALENADYGSKLADLQMLLYSNKDQITDFRTAVAQLAGESITSGVEARTMSKAITDMANIARESIESIQKELTSLRDEFVDKEETDDMKVLSLAVAKLKDRVAACEEALGIEVD